MSYQVPNNSAPSLDSGSLLMVAWDKRIEHHGRWIVYVRGDRRFPCPNCYDPSTDDVDSDTKVAKECAYCFGLGYKSTLERMKCHIALDVKKTYSTRSGIAPAYYGDVESSGGLLYLRGGAYPQYQDLIFETEWDVPYSQVSERGTPTRLVTGWRVMRPNPVIGGDNGTVDLWICGLQRHALKAAFLESQLRSAGERLQPAGQLEGLAPSQSRPYGGEGRRDAPKLGSSIKAKDVPGRKL